MSNSTFVRSEYAVLTELSRLMTILNDNDALRRYPRDMFADVYELLDHLPPRTLARWYEEHTPELRKVQALRAQ